MPDAPKTTATGRFDGVLNAGVRLVDGTEDAVAAIAAAMEREDWKTAHALTKALLVTLRSNKA